MVFAQLRNSASRDENGFNQSTADTKKKPAHYFFIFFIFFFFVCNFAKTPFRQNIFPGRWVLMFVWLDEVRAQPQKLANQMAESRKKWKEFGTSTKF